MSHKVNFHVVRSALQNSVCLLIGDIFDHPFLRRNRLPPWPVFRAPRRPLLTFKKKRPVLWPNPIRAKFWSFVGHGSCSSGTIISRSLPQEIRKVICAQYWGENFKRRWRTNGISTIKSATRHRIWGKAWASLHPFVTQRDWRDGIAWLDALTSPLPWSFFHRLAQCVVGWRSRHPWWLL